MRGRLLGGLILIAVGVAGLAVTGVAGMGTWQAWTVAGSGPWGWMMGWGHMGGRMGPHMGGQGQRAASGTASAPLAGAATIEVVGVDFGFRPVELRIRTGQTVNIALVNRGAILHDLTVPRQQFQLVAQPGQRVAGAITAAAPGTYELFCSVPGHREAGMIGRLVVTP